jgi:two-component system sensor histidine kinase BaeS
MDGVVSRMLALARSEAHVPAERTRVDLDALVRQVVADLEPLAAARRLTASVHAEPVAVIGERDALRDAIAQVVVNAIRYNVDGGSIRIDARGDGGMACLTVSDTGVGIGPGDLPRVFEPFFRADPARARETGGAGLGLAIAHAVVTRHGGRIRVDSSAGHGTTVEIALPGST